jgi:CMP/dCMP kinase
VTDFIRNETIAAHIGRISDDREVRNFVNRLLRKWAEEGSVIVDGRDISSIVFPDAEVKVFLDASIDTRAQRRIKEYRERGKNVDEKVIKNQIIQRDEQDKKRPFGALIRSKDAVYIDTSNMDMEEVVSRIKELINKA